jgi:hypothetical protein
LVLKKLSYEKRLTVEKVIVRRKEGKVSLLANGLLNTRDNTIDIQKERYCPKEEGDNMRK